MPDDARGAGRRPRGNAPADLAATRIEPLESPPLSPALADATILDQSLESLLAQAPPAKDDPSATIFDQRPLADLAAAPRAQGPRPIDIPPEALRPAPPTPTPGAAGLLFRRLSARRRTLLLALTFVLLAIRVIAVARRPAGTGAAPRASPSSSTARPAIEAVSARSAPPSLPETFGAAPAPTGGKTLARLAVDAVATGAYREAITRYDALRQQYPDRIAYREAARILRAKVAAEAR